MKRTMGKIAGMVMGLALMVGTCTACGAQSDTEYFLDNRYSLLYQNGELADNGMVGDIDYRILEQGSIGSNYDKAGYYIDTLEEPNAPYFIVVNAGKGQAEDYEIEIVDLAMEESTLWILVREKDGRGDKDNSTSPCCALQVDHLPEDISVVAKTGRTFQSLTEQ